MKWREWLENWSMSSLKIKSPFLEMQWEPKDQDKAAAWDLYIELLTRITTQPLSKAAGDESAALDSIHKLFGLTRDTIKKHGRECIEFTKIAVVVLNQVIRPFTAKWHNLSIQNAFNDEDKCNKFRNELSMLQSKLRTYTQMLAQMADVEDLTELEMSSSVSTIPTADSAKPLSVCGKPYIVDQYEKLHKETVAVSACKSCNKPFSVKRRPSKPNTINVVIGCPFCGKLLSYRKRTKADDSTDMNHVADLSLHE